MVTELVAVCEMVLTKLMAVRREATNVRTRFSSAAAAALMGLSAQQSIQGYMSGLHIACCSQADGCMQDGASKLGCVHSSI